MKLYSDPQIEQACIGCVLLDSPSVMDMCIEKRIKPEYFSSSLNRLVFGAMLKHVKKGNVVDQVVLKHQFSDHEVLSKDDYYLDCVDTAVSRTNAPRYFDVLNQLYVKREIGNIADEIARLRDDEYSNSDELVAKAQATVLALNRHENAPNKHSMPDRITRNYKAARDGECVGISSPFKIFDEATGGPRAGLHTILAGPRGTGKSTVVVNWNLHLGQEGIPTAVFAMEDGALRYWAKTAACYGEYNEWRMSMGGVGKVRLSDRELEKAQHCLETVTNMPIYVDGKRGMTIDQIKSKASQYKAQYGIKCLWIDGFKDIRKERSDSMVEDARISAGLCDIAESLDISVISIHHVTKQSSKEGTNFKMEDIRGNGVILDDARMVLLLQPDSTLDCVKNNYGPTFAIDLDIDLKMGQVSACGNGVDREEEEAEESKVEPAKEIVQPF